MIFESELRPSELINRLKDSVSENDSNWLVAFSDGKKYIGEITDESFKLKRKVYHKQTRYYELIGQISTYHEKSVINVKFSLAKGFVIGFILIVSFAVLVTISISFNLKGSVNDWTPFLIPGIFILFIFLKSFLGLKRLKKHHVDFLSEIFESHPL